MTQVRRLSKLRGPFLKSKAGKLYGIVFALKFDEPTTRELAKDAKAAARHAHDKGLAQRGSVMKVDKRGMLVVEQRDGRVEEIRKLAAPTAVRAGAVFKRRTPKGRSVIA